MTGPPIMVEEEAPERRQRPETGWERHIQSALGAILVGLIWWVGTSVQSQSIAIAQLQVTVSATSAQMVTLLSQTQRTVSASQESSDIQRLQSETDALRGRVRRVEERLPPHTGSNR